ncbi:hypothetical protein Esti_005160 [Eimeria stiedai]
MPLSATGSSPCSSLAPGPSARLPRDPPSVRPAYQQGPSDCTAQHAAYLRPVEGGPLGMQAASSEGWERLQQKLEAIQLRGDHTLAGTRAATPKGLPQFHQASKICLHFSPDQVEASLRRVADLRRRESERRATAETRDSSQEGVRQSRSLVEAPEADVKGAPVKRAAAASVLLRLHSIQFCFDEGSKKEKQDTGKTKVAYCVTARFLALAAQHAPEDAATSSFTTAWYAAAVSHQQKAESAAAASGATETEERLDAEVYRMESCQLEADIRLPLPGASFRSQVLTTDKVLLEVWRHNLSSSAEGPAPSPAATAPAAAEAAAKEGVQLVGEVVVDFAEGAKTSEGKCILPIASPSKEKDAAALAASLRRSGTLHATIPSRPPVDQQQQQQQRQERQQQQQQQQQHGLVWEQTSVSKHSAFESREKTWRYIDDHGKVQGPFSSKQMFLWIRKGYFEETTPVFDTARPTLKFHLKEVAALIAAEAQRAALANVQCPSTRETTQSDSGSPPYQQPQDLHKQQQQHQQQQHQQLLSQQQQQPQQKGLAPRAGGLSHKPPSEHPQNPQQQQRQQQTRKQEQEEKQQQQQQGTTAPLPAVTRVQERGPPLRRSPTASSRVSVRLRTSPAKPFHSSPLPLSPYLPASAAGAAAAGWQTQEQQLQQQESPRGPCLDAAEVRSVFASLNEASRCLRNIKKHKMSSYLKCSIAAPSPDASFRVAQLQRLQQQQQQQQIQPQQLQQQQHESLSRIYVRQRLALLRDTFGEEALYEACAVYIQAAYRGWRTRRQYRVQRGAPSRRPPSRDLPPHHDFCMQGKLPRGTPPGQAWGAHLPDVWSPTRPFDAAYAQGHSWSEKGAAASTSQFYGHEGCAGRASSSHWTNANLPVNM